MIKNKKLLITLVLVIGIISIIVVNWQKGTQSKLEKLHPIEYSKNQEASREFLKAMEYKIYISQLHSFFDYDSFIMIPFLEKMNFHFNKGKNLLPQNSVEDIVWFAALYKDIYALVVPEKDDYSLAYEKLPFDEFAKKHDEIFEMIKRYPFGEINFDIKQINEYRFQTMSILVGFYLFGETRKLKNKKVGFNDKASLVFIENYKEILNLYEIVKEKYLNSSSFYEDMKLTYIRDIVSLSSNIILHDVQFKTVTEKETISMSEMNLSKEWCSSKEALIIKDNTTILLNSLKMNTQKIDSILNNVFKNDSYIALFVKLGRECENLNPNMNYIALSAFRINKKIKKGEKLWK